MCAVHTKAKVIKTEDLKRQVKILREQGYTRKEICKKLGIDFYPLDYLIKKWKLERRNEEYLVLMQKDNEYMQGHFEAITKPEQKPKVCPFCNEHHLENPNSDMCPYCEMAYRRLERIEVECN